MARAGRREQEGSFKKVFSRMQTVFKLENSSVYTELEISCPPNQTL